MSGNPTLVAMVPANGAIGGEIHAEGCIIKPDAAGVFWIPAQYVLSMIHAGYMWASLIQNTTTRDPAQTNL